MNIANKESFFIILAFIVPGFIIYVVKSKFTTGRIRTGPDIFIYYLFYSAVNYTLFGWIIYFIIFTDVLYDYPIIKYISWSIILFASPVFIGIIIGIADKHQWFNRILRCIGINPIHSVPTAWDYCFGSMKFPHWIIVTLKDGTKIYGYFGAKSIASSSDNERDLVLEQMFKIDANNSWEALKEGHGVLITKEQISYVEFWPT